MASGHVHWKDRPGPADGVLDQREIGQDRAAGRRPVSDSLFDTNVLADWLRGRPEAATELARDQRHRISRMEILADEQLETREINRGLPVPFEIVEPGSRIALAATGIRYRSRMKLREALILAVAEMSGAILSTRNTRDVPANLPGIRVPCQLS